MNFMFLENKIKVCSKFYKKIFFVIWSLYVVIYKINDSVEFYSNFWMYLVLYFIHQIRSFCMISIFIINTKINFCILLFNEFYVFGKWKSSFEILQKKFFS